MKTENKQPTCYRRTSKVLTELCTNVHEGGVGVGPNSLTVSRELRKLGTLFIIAPSSNGKTADSGSAYRGSNPCGAAALRTANCGLRKALLNVPSYSEIRIPQSAMDPALSSNGLGRGPLKAEIRVRSPLGLRLFCQSIFRDFQPRPS